MGVAAADPIAVLRDLVEAVAMSRPPVSHYLAGLHETGLVTTRQAGGFTF